MMRFMPMLLCSGCLALAACAFGPAKDPTWLMIPSDAQPSFGAGSREHVSVGPIGVPGYLRRSDVFVRRGPVSGTYDGSVQWCESMEDGIARALAADLGSMLGEKGMSVAPASFQMPARRRIFVNVARFDGAPGADLVLEATWGIVTSRGDVLRIGSFSGSERVGPTMQDLADAHGVLLRRLAASLRLPLAGE